MEELFDEIAAHLKTKDLAREMVYWLEKCRRDYINQRDSISGIYLAITDKRIAKLTAVIKKAKEQLSGYE